MQPTITLTWAQPDERPEGREDPCWYTFGHGHDLVVRVTRGDRTIEIYSDGEMDVRVYDKPNGSTEVGRIRYCEQFREYGMNNDAEVFEAHEAGRIEWVHNPWFDLYSEDGEHLDVVCHTVTDAIAKATEVINDDTDPIWAGEEN
jgi:hypothetical protein